MCTSTSGQLVILSLFPESIASPTVFCRFAVFFFHLPPYEFHHVMMQLPSCSIFWLCPPVTEFSSSHLLNFRTDGPKAKRGIWRLASVNRGDPNRPHGPLIRATWSRWRASRPYIKTYIIIVLNSHHRAHGAGNRHGNRSDCLQLHERIVLNEMWTKDFEKSLVFRLNGFTWKLNKRDYYRHTMRVWDD